MAEVTETDNQEPNAPAETIFAAKEDCGIPRLILVSVSRVMSAMTVSIHVMRPKTVTITVSVTNSGCVSATQVILASVVNINVILPRATNTVNVMHTENAYAIPVTMVGIVPKNVVDKVAASKNNVFATSVILEYSANLNATVKEPAGHLQIKQCNATVIKIGLGQNARLDVARDMAKNAPVMVSVWLL